MSRARCVLAITGLDCPVEASVIREALRDWPGGPVLEFNLLKGTVTIDFDPEQGDRDAIARRIAERTGWRTAPVHQEAGDEHHQHWFEQRHWLQTALSGLALVLGALLERIGVPLWAFRAAYLVAIAIGAAPLLVKAVRGLRGGRLDVHSLMLVAVIGAVGLGQWDEAATVAFLFGLSDALEALSIERANRAVRGLLEIAPETAEVVTPEGAVVTVPASVVRTGERVRVRAGERIPVDGRVRTGHSSVDQRAITGESLPVPVEPGSEVLAGTVNGDGALEIAATRPLDEAIVTRMVARARAAQSTRTPIERTIERFAAVYTPIVVFLAGFVMGVVPVLVWAAQGASGRIDWRDWIMRGLVVLMVSCPCALVIGTPVAVVSALACAARRGILIKGGPYLEEFGKLRVLAFDKTGTLTRGEPVVVEVVPMTGRAHEEVLGIAAALGDQGGHVLGKAISRHARGLKITVPEAHDYEAIPGRGASACVGSTRYHVGSHRYLDEAGLCHDELHASIGAAESSVGTSVLLTAKSGPLGWIRLADHARPEAVQALADLRELKIETVMLTGDNHPTAAAIARELGIDEHRAALLPDEKADVLAQLESKHGPAGMIGDGTNDAPALAAARVSVALGGASSGAAIETADIVLMADDLSGLPWLVRHSRRTIARIEQNIAIAVGIKLIVLALAILGLANLWMAIAADMGVSLLVVANALRLLRTA